MIIALPVKLQAVVDVMEAQSDEVTAYINRKTGELAAVSDEEISYAERDDDDGFIPEWQEELVEQGHPSCKLEAGHGMSGSRLASFPSTVRVPIPMDHYQR